MRKIFLPALALLLVIAVSSCGASKHRCPAYGSIDNSVESGTSKLMIDSFLSTEQKG